MRKKPAISLPLYQLHASSFDSFQTLSKKFPKAAEEDLFAEVQRLRAENEYLKNLHALVLEDERRQRRKRR